MTAGTQGEGAGATWAIRRGGGPCSLSHVPPQSLGREAAALLQALELQKRERALWIFTFYIITNLDFVFILKHMCACMCVTVCVRDCV